MRRASNLSRLGKASWAAVFSLALFTGVIAVTPATAMAAPVADQKELASSASAAAGIVPASWDCSYMLSRYRADAYCDIYSGAIRLRSVCSDSSYVTSRYYTTGYAHLSTDCYPYYRVRSWIDSIG